MDRASFGEKVLLYTKSLYYVSRSMLKHKEDQEDAVQATIITGMLKCGMLRDDEKLKPWITRILINECHSVLKKRKREFPSDDVISHSTAEVDISLRDAVMQLDEKKRIPFILYVDGYTMIEISRILRLPEGTVKGRIRSAKTELRRALGDKEVIV